MAKLIPFGKNGLKRPDGTIVRTDHPSMRDVLDDLLDKSPTRNEILDKRVDDAINGISKLKARQDKLAGNTRRKA